MSLTLSLARCHYPVRGLGYGQRVGIWFQGCSIRCGGCIVPETWDATALHAVDMKGLLTALQPWLEQCNGVTISGGEPFDQPLALFALLTGLRHLCNGDLLVYSGHAWNRLQALHADILGLCDVVVSEPFLAARAEASPLRGSANQSVHLLTSLARARYQNWEDFPREASVASEGDLLRLAGIIPRPQLVQVARAVAQTGREVQLTHGSI